LGRFLEVSLRERVFEPIRKELRDRDQRVKGDRENDPLDKVARFLSSRDRP